MKKVIKFLVLCFLIVPVYGKSYSRFYIGNKSGLIDENRNIVFEAERGYVFCLGKYFVKELYGEEKSVSIYDNKMKEILKLDNCSYIKNYSENELIIKSDRNKYEILNLKTMKLRNYEKEIVNYIFETYVNGKSVVLKYLDKYRRYGFAIENEKGNEIVSDIKNTDSRYSEGLIPVLFFNGESGFLDENGKMAIKVPLYDDFRLGGPKISTSLNYTFFDGVAFIQTERDKWFLLDKKGNKKEIPVEFCIDADYIFMENKAPITEYNESVKYLIYQLYYSNGVTKVQGRNGKFGYINKNFELVIPCIFDSASSFGDKYAAVIHEGKDAVIDLKGNVYYCSDFVKR